MAKRPIQSSDDEQSNAHSPKRARTSEEIDDDEEIEASQVTRPQKKAKAKSKGKQRAKDDEGQDGEDDEELDTEDKAFEDLHAERIRAGLEAGRKVSGGIADYGIIESIEMHQFMCHKYLTFNFGPQVNFIIGHNGSGKSAVLSAITVALGGKANSTGRGSGLKAFIREGQAASEVTITLKNQGEEAFKPKEYGKSIAITRRFTKEGNSSWKIKSKDGKVISTKRDELSAICDHMNIQVDNPMNVLTQDAARQFLSAANPSDKYKFFLKGTQLTQLSDEYETCLENVTQTANVLNLKKQAIPDLKAVFKEATLRFEEAAKAREQRKKVDELKSELAWSHVSAKQEELAKKVEECTKQSRRTEKVKEGLDEAKVAFDKASQKVAAHEVEHSNLGDVDHLNAEKKRIQDEIRQNKQKITEFKAEEAQMDSSLKQTNNIIKDLEAKIKNEAEKLESNTQAKREALSQKIAEAEAKFKVAEKEYQDVIERGREKKAEGERLANEARQADLAREKGQQRILDAQAMIQQCKEQEQDSMKPYGKNIKGVLEQIERTVWAGERPLGPLGLNVRVKDGEKWAELLRSQLAGLLTAFAVTDARDRPTLKRILDASGNNSLMIIIYERDLFDYSRGEPGPDFLTVLRALEVDDPFVLRILINQARIERTFLAKTRRVSEDLFRVAGPGQAFTADGFRVTRYPEGGGSSNPLNFLFKNDPRNLLFSGRDAAGALRHYQQEAATADHEYKELIAKSKHARDQYQDCNRLYNNLGRQEKELAAKAKAAKNAVNALRDQANEDMPADLSAFEDAKNEAKQEAESIVKQFEELQQKKAVVDAAQHPLLEKLTKVKADIAEFESKRSGIQSKIEEAAAGRMQAQTNVSYFEKKLEEEKRKLKVLEDASGVLEQEFQLWTNRAREYCEPVENPRKVDVVERALNSVQAALDQREKRHGSTVEEMTVEVNKAKANLESAEKDLKIMNSLNKALKNSLVTRLAKWQEFRRHIALRCRLVFQYLLSIRGYYGKVSFDHNMGTLNLRVQTDDQMGTQGAKDKDPKSLSGGEKSFSTICLLLSLWESIGCPIRCLDEFDVFMDAVNRRISMKMMIDTANASDKKQYVLITPQDMGNIKIGNTVRVHRMTDPERGQMRLDFA